MWLYVHEVGRRHGFHTHILTAIPDELRDDLRAWMAMRMAKLSRIGSVPKGAFKIVAPPSDKIGRQWRYLQYLCKGLGTAEEVAASVGTEPNVKAASLVRTASGRSANILCKKRCGVSNNIGVQARRRSQYESPLERGITDVRQLYAGMEYLGCLRKHNLIPSDSTHAQLLQNEKRIQEIQVEDAAMSAEYHATRKIRKNEQARQGRVAKQRERDHKDCLARLSKLVI